VRFSDRRAFHKQLRLNFDILASRIRELDRNLLPSQSCPTGVMDEFVSRASEHETIHVYEEGRHFVHADKSEDVMDETRLRKSKMQCLIDQFDIQKKNH
jgi:hypothetical protein